MRDTLKCWGARGARLGGGLLLGIALWTATAKAGDLDLPDVSLVEASTVAEMPSPEIGEVREFVGSVATIDCSRWEIIESDDADSLVSQCGDYKFYFKRSEHLNMHKVTGAKGVVAVEFTPAYPGIQFPLTVGKHWRKPYKGHSAIEDISWAGDVECEVAEYAQVEVAAGVFKAFRIECRDHWKVGDAESSVTSTTWYAPDAGGVVKTLNYEDARWNTELKAFSGPVEE
jgi:hypothetical protein